MDEKILARVRGLLAKAESTEFAEEAEALTAKAADLVAKYGIDQALLAAAGKTRDEIGRLEIRVENPYARDKIDLLTAVHNPLRCKSVRWRTGYGYRVIVVGFESDLERVELLYTSLLLQATRRLVAVRPDGAVFGESTTAYRKSWLHGFARAVQTRLRDAEARAAASSEVEQQSGSSSTALVLVNRKDRVTSAYDEMFPDAKKAAKRRLTGSGYRDGRVAGERADLGNGRVSGGRTAIR